MLFKISLPFASHDGKVTQKINGQAMAEIRRLIQASREGELKTRVDVQAFAGDLAELMNGINTILDEALEPVNVQVAALEAMAAGKLSQKISQEFKGDHNRGKNALNQVAGIGGKAQEEIRRMIEASRRGDLKARAEVQQFEGDWREIMTGVNTILDEALGPVDAQVELLSKMVAGDLSARITADFKGDHQRIKDLLNGFQQFNQQVVEDIVQISQKLAEGNLRATAQAQYRGDFAQIKNSLESALDNLRGVIEDLAQVSGGLGSGNLTVTPRGEYRGDFVQIREGLEAALVSLNRTMTQASHVTTQVAQSVGQVRAVSQDLASNAEEQSSAAEEVTSNLEETEAQVKANADNASLANQLVTETAKTAESGQTKMKSMTGAMTAIAQSSQEINKIIKVIDEIAFQTNLLALNAAVEAARAGQHGRGFAVVAQEVRTLAGRSARAAKETSELIETSVRRVQEGVGIAEEMATSLGDIVQQVVKVKDLVAEINIASEEQAKGIVEVNRAMMQVSEGAQNNSQQSEELASTADEMGSLADRLREEMGRFHLDKEAGYGRGQEQDDPAEELTPDLPTTTTRSRRLTKGAPAAIARGKAPAKSKETNGRFELTLDRDERGYDQF
ncbi:MAG: hypothetical protein KJ077_03465 [Anaerolineae bacterium]|nr:hypothetical protein [Anaerolineae bacterium]